MRNKKSLSPQTKRILTGIGVAFGTIIIFFVSFFLSFNFIVNPITFTNIGDSDTEKENKELKKEVQALNDEIEVLNTTVEKYKKNSPSAPPVVTTQQSEPSTTENTISDSTTTTKTETTTDEPSTKPETEAPEEVDEGNGTDVTEIEVSW